MIDDSTLSSFLSPALLVVHPEEFHQVDSTDTVYFTCISLGRPYSSIIWSKNGTDVNAQTDTHITIKEEYLTERETKEVYIKSTIEICNVDGKDNGSYTCTADNGVGSDNASFALTVHTTKGMHVV